VLRHLCPIIACLYNFCRPLAFYILIEYLFIIKHVVLLSIGFRAQRHAGFKYYVYGKLPNEKGEHRACVDPAELATPAHCPLMHANALRALEQAALAG